MGILWIVVIGFVAGIVARLVSPVPNKPAGFLLTTLLGIGGAFVATFLGQAVGWYRAEQGAGFVAATLGALLVLFIWNRFAVRRPARCVRFSVRFDRIQCGLAVVEIDLHAQLGQRLDAMGLLRLHKARPIGREDRLGAAFGENKLQFALEHADHAPHAVLGAMLPLQRLGQRRLVEDGRRAVGRDHAASLISSACSG